MSGDSVLILGIGVLVTLVVMLPFLLAQRRRERRARQAELRALRYGLQEPVSLHPVVDPEGCIGTSACVAACPEDHVLGIRNGQAQVIAPARCIGHGLCERACPVEAIQLVFGSEQRGVDIPRVKGNFETDVPGLYVIGELGGMGLIRNAFEQGRQCIEGIRRANGRNGTDAIWDVAIVGCGPAGLSASLNCQHHGLRFLTLEKEDVGGTVRNYPRKKLVMTAPVQAPGYGKLSFREISKEGLMGLWEEIIHRTGLQVRTGETVSGVERLPAGGFEVITAAGRHRAQRVVLAIGRRGVPRKLGVPGEGSPRVAYALREPEAYHHDRILVVGGGDSAVEAALTLAEQPGNTVRLSYRGDRFTRIKDGNRQRLEAALDRHDLAVLYGTQLDEIADDHVRYHDAGGAAHDLPTDRVFIFIGGELPTAFLRRCGVTVETKFGTP